MKRYVGSYSFVVFGQVVVSTEARTPGEARERFKNMIELCARAHSTDPDVELDLDSLHTKEREFGLDGHSPIEIVPEDIEEGLV